MASDDTKIKRPRIVLTCRCAPPQAPAIVEGTLACGRCFTPMTIQGTGNAVHSQHDGERPCSSKNKYLRIWKVGHDAGDPEVWAEGRDRRMTPDAWQRHARSVTLLVGQPANETTADESVLAELGLERASA